MTTEELRKKADQIRDAVIRVAVQNKAGHIAPSLSTVDILVALYYEIMQPFKLQASSFMITNSPYNISEYSGRDRLVLSKAHGCYALYAILADLGVIPIEVWQNFNISTSPYPRVFPYSLRGCVEYRPYWGLEAGTGSLGHGLPMAVGMAYAAKLRGEKYKVYCILGDGECQEGTTWEAVEFACHKSLDNLCIIVDCNSLMAMSETGYNAQDLYDRFVAFGCSALVVDGHKEIRSGIISEMSVDLGIPHVVIAETIKGYGLKCMEGVAKFHYRVPTEEELAEGRTYGRDHE